MRILEVFYLPTHHFLPFADCLAKLVGEDNFRYGALYYPRLTEERQKLGWNYKGREPWILHLENERDLEQFERWWDEADVVLCGERFFSRMKNRLVRDKLTFYMSERWWKPPIGIARLLYPRFALMTAHFKTLALSPSLHYLPIGGYAAHDMEKIASFPGRMWNWGYFTATPEPLPACERKDPGFRVLWAGRMLDSKRVDVLIKAFSVLLTKRPDATLTIVGMGPKRKQLEGLASKLLSAGSYQFKSAMPAAEIPLLMRHHHVYVFPSGGSEGWGAVINEAMAEGCLVIANEEGGAAKTIIRHGENGLLFSPGDWRRLSELLCEMSSDDSARVRLARDGQKTIVQCWSPAIAAERFVTVCESLLAQQPPPLYRDGPMASVRSKMEFPYKLLGPYRPLSIERSGRLWVSRGYDVYYSDDLGMSFSFRACLDRRWLMKLSANWALTTRLLRQGFIHLLPLRDGSLLGVIHGRIVRCDADSDRFVQVLERPGRTMKIEIMPEGTIFAGEYFYNRWRDPVHIFRSNDEGRTWEDAYRFKSREIRHIHLLKVDKRSSSLLILTGDKDQECKMLVTNGQFNPLRVLSGGTQRSRSMSILPTDGGYYVATDTELEQNHIQFLSFDGALSIRCPIVGSCLGGCQVGDWSVFATATEPSPVNHDPYVSLYGSRDGQEWHVLHRWRVDRWSWPSKLQAAAFEMGRVILPAGENDTGYLFGTPVAVRTNAGILHRWKLS